MSKFNPDVDIGDLSGKVILVTGGTDGIGKQSVLALARHAPSHIYFAGRDEKAAELVIKETTSVSPSVPVTFLRCDLGSRESIRSALSNFNSDTLDIVILCAGIMATPAGLTNDGYEVQFGINHMGHASLLKLVLPTMLRTAELPDSDVRIVTVSSLLHQVLPHGGIAFDTLHSQQENRKLGAWGRYAQSKLANTLYGLALARKYPSIKSVVVHPGIVNTNLSNGVSYISRLFLYTSTLGGLLTLSPESGANSILWAATADQSRVKSGRFYEPIGKARAPEKSGMDEEAAQRLWDWTQNELDGFP
ncbi:oxidoreductase [Trichoderma velutinum]